MSSTMGNDPVGPASDSCCGLHDRGGRGVGCTGRRVQDTGRVVRRFTADLSATGEPALWGLGGALAIGVILIAGLPVHDRLERDDHLLAQAHRAGRTVDGPPLAGEPTRTVNTGWARTSWPGCRPRTGPRSSRAGFANRVLYKTANFDLYGDDFRWVSEFEVANVEYPKDFFLLERQQWGTFVGRIKGLTMAVSRCPSMWSGCSGRSPRRATGSRRSDGSSASEIGAVNHYLDASG
jgi:phosphate transport system permease protein